MDSNRTGGCHGRATPMLLVALLLLFGIAVGIAQLVAAPGEYNPKKSPMDLLDPTPFGNGPCALAGGRLPNATPSPIDQQ
ncbi:hypothetical protein niasHT_006005 [Heterodera trifolii]|uniref:Uncharacterized protein n=1 Tax=Heterodera trifolii TaxID=157864 RepID=A0ABD2LWX5_9BILA